MRRIAVTGAQTPLGRRLVEHLRAVPGVDQVAAVDLADDHRTLADFVGAREIDTFVHCALTADRSGAASTPAGADVIATMRLCAAVGHRSLPVRSLVLVSSSDVYPARSHAARLHREDGETESSETAPAASLLEAEDYARDVAERSPHLCVAILRFAELAGPSVRGPLSSLLARPVWPAALGFDPALQLLHVDDAVRALAYAAEVELAGVYNVASQGVVYLSEAARALRRRVVPVLPLEAGSLAPLLRALRLPHVPNGMLDLLRFGRALDTSKLARAGFSAKFEQSGCLDAVAHAEAGRA